MRLFTAIGAETLSFDPVSAFKKLKVGLEKKEIEHRWVPVENYHVTLNFIGELDSHMVTVITDAMKEVAARHLPFNLKVDGMGAFPSERSGRVITVGIQNSRALRELQADLENTLRDNGLQLEEREYRPHLTVARLRSPRNLKDLLSPLAKHSFGELFVNMINLYESKQGTGAFPVYIPVESVKLG